MYRVVRRPEALVRKIAENKVAVNYITKDISQEVSLAIIEATDYYEKETTAYNRIYYVLDGTLVLVFNGEEMSLHVGDTCFIEKGMTYEMKGTFEVVVVNQPAFGTNQNE